MKPNCEDRVFEYEALYYQQQDVPAIVVGLT